MKLSHFLIAALLSSSVIGIAQTEPKNKKNKPKAKTEKKHKDKQLLCTVKVYKDTINFHPKFNCPACGRG